MRAPLAVLGAAMFFAVTVAHAEQRLFIIASNPDGYGVDRCLASGAGCGLAVATAYCKSRKFGQALSFRTVDRDEITGAVPHTGKDCDGGTCSNFVAIRCAR